MEIRRRCSGSFERANARIRTRDKRLQFRSMTKQWRFFLARCFAGAQSAGGRPGREQDGARGDAEFRYGGEDGAREAQREGREDPAG